MLRTKRRIILKQKVSRLKKLQYHHSVKREAIDLNSKIIEYKAFPYSNLAYRLIIKKQ